MTEKPGRRYDIQVNRLDAYLRSVLSSKGEHYLEAIEPTLSMQIDMLDPPMSERILAGWRSYVAGQAVTGDATHVAQVGIAMRSDVPAIAVLDEVTILCTGAVAELQLSARVLSVFPGGGTLNVTANGIARDRRTPIVGSACLVGTQNALAPLGTGYGAALVDEVLSATDSLFRVVKAGDRDSFVITQNMGWLWTSNANAETLFVLWKWRERALEASETYVRQG